MCGYAAIAIGLVLLFIVLARSKKMVIPRVRCECKNASIEQQQTRVEVSKMYAHMAKALVSGYIDAYYVDLRTEEFVEFCTGESLNVLEEARHGHNFFSECRKDIQERVHSEDRDKIGQTMERTNLLKLLSQTGTYAISYRIMEEGNSDPMYVSMRITQMPDDGNILVIGVEDIDDQMRREKQVRMAEEEQTAYRRLSALAGDFICVYIVSLETGKYREFSATAGYDSYAIPKDGSDFFSTTRENTKKVIHEDDVDRFLAMFTKETVINGIRENGFFSISYRLYFAGNPIFVQLKATIIKEDDEEQLLVGVNNIDSQVRQEEDYEQRLAKAQRAANKDPLTGVKSRRAYADMEAELNRQIARDRQSAKFAIVVLDVNGLKKINDTHGHKAGDRCIIEACRVICTTFKHSPVFRIGGDEFAVVSQGDDYTHIEELVGKIADQNETAVRVGSAAIACGMSKYRNDSNVASVFDRADSNMYKNKAKLKRVT